MKKRHRVPFFAGEEEEKEEGEGEGGEEEEEEETSVLINDRNSLYTHFYKNNVRRQSS